VTREGYATIHRPLTNPNPEDTMQQVKKTADYTIYQKKSGRYAVKGKDKQWVLADDKTRILTTEQLIKPPEPKAPVVETEPEAPAEGQPES
jgi:hypothetical protein